MKDGFVLCCPGCGDEKSPEWVVGTAEYSANRLDVPYYMCGRCRLIYVDEALIRSVIGEWRKDKSPSRIKDMPPIEELIKEATAIVNVVVNYYCRTASYKGDQFVKPVS